HVFSPNTLNDLKFQYGRREFEVATNDPVGPEIIISGVAEFGREFFNPSAYETNIFQVADNATFIRGSHTLKIGADLNVMNLAGFAEVFLGGQFSFGERVPLGAIMDNLLGDGTAEGLAAQLATPQELGGLGRPDLVANVMTPVSPVQAFNFGLPITYFQGFGDPTADVDYSQLGFFLQDNWRVNDKFTLNLGIRYDLDWRPETLNVASTQPPFDFRFESVKDRNNVSPRLGFAWDPTGNGRTVLRGGYGIYYQNFFQAFAFTVDSVKDRKNVSRRLGMAWAPPGNGRTVIRGGYGIYYQNFFQAIAFVSQVLSGQIEQVFLPLTGLPGIAATSSDVYQLYLQNGRIGEAELQSLGIAPGVTPSVILPGASDVVNPYSQHAAFGLEQQFGENWVIGGEYVLNRGVHLIRSRDINVREVGPNQFALPGLDPRYTQINMIETSGSSIYHGLNASLRKRFDQHHGLMISYTLGKAIDDTTDFITQLQPNNQRDLVSERSLSTFDQRHRLVVSSVLQSPLTLPAADNFFEGLLADWTVAPIVTAASGRPFNLLVGFDLNNDTHEETDRPILESGEIVGRNTGVGPAFFTTD